MVALARALLNENRLLLVDEPTKGLAPKLVHEVADALERAAEVVPILLVEQNLRRRPPPGDRRRRHRRAATSYTPGTPASSLDDEQRVVALLGVGSASTPADREVSSMNTVVLLVITGLGLGALYFLVASGLSLIYGLMGVLNFAHGSFLTLGAFAGWETARRLGGDTWLSLLVSLAVGAGTGALAAIGTELLLIRRLYERHIEQVLVTVGLALATVALFDGIWGTDAILVSGPRLVRRDDERPRGQHPQRPFRADRGGRAGPAGDHRASCGSPASAW